MRTRPTALIATTLLCLCACSTNTEWRRANREADWLLTKIRTLKISDRMNRDRDIRLADLERERLELELQVRALQRDGDHAAREGDQEGLDEVIARLEVLKGKYGELADKY